MTKNKLTRQQIKQAKMVLGRDSRAAMHAKTARSALTDSGHNKETNDNAKQEPNKDSAPKSRTEDSRMSGAILAISSVVCAVLFCVVIAYWSKEGYANIRTGFYWLIPTCIAFAVVVLSAYWYYVVKPARPSDVATKKPIASARKYACLNVTDAKIIEVSPERGKDTGLVVNTSPNTVVLKPGIAVVLEVKIENAADTPGQEARPTAFIGVQDFMLPEYPVYQGNQIEPFQSSTTVTKGGIPLILHGPALRLLPKQIEAINKQKAFWSSTALLITWTPRSSGS